MNSEEQTGSLAEISQGFNYQGCLEGLQKFWDLTDDDVQAIMIGTSPDSDNWRHRILQLFGIKSVLSDVRRSLTVEARLEYERSWLRTERPLLENQTPLQVLRAGNTEAVQQVLDFITI